MNKFVLSMAALRILSGSIEFLAALAMIRLNQLEKALLINSSLALIGPFIFLVATSVGFFGLTDKLSFTRMLWIAAGVGLIFIGILKK